MSSASFFRQWRRPLVLGTLVVLLHWLVLGWIMSGMSGTQDSALPGRDGDALVSLAELLPASRSEAPAPVPPPEPRLPQPPLPDFAPLPPNVVVIEDVAGEPVQPGPPADTPSVAAEPAPRVAAAEPVPLPVPAPEDEPAPAPEIRRYKVDVPPPADIRLDVARQDADGTQWSGEALLSWKMDGAAYRVRIEAGIRVVFARVNLVVLTSEGTVGNTGFMPVRMTEKRRGRALTATHFDWPANALTFSSSQARHGLMPGAQDKATVPLQLAAIARGDPAQLAGDIDIFVGEERDGSVYTFKVMGQEEIDTALGRLATVRLARPPKPGSYKTRLDIWLSPSHGWMPVQIRSTEASGAVTTQTVNNIALTQPGF
ncbi:DUF3108 domain-containing protein [Massilia consociata]|uniref:DUF3108 domain-containing protein n=1 Tax=Massilia consociata TaxID=760117 RepID=A0ABV6FK66_9BURK